jgi:hypothetical protein
MHNIWGSLPDDEHTLLETCSRQEEFNQNIYLKSAFCWLTWHNCMTEICSNTRDLTDKIVCWNTITIPKFSFFASHTRAQFVVTSVNTNVNWIHNDTCHTEEMSEGCGFDFRRCNLNFSLTYSFRSHMALGLTWPLIEMKTRDISWGVKETCAKGWQCYHLYVPIILKSGSLNLLEPSGFVQNCKGISLP